jgi:DNA-binding HxlR family transcriptional regulator
MDPTVQMTGELSPRGAWKADGCSIATSLEVLSARSAFLILREAFYGTTRFADFAERAGISEPVAAARLRELVQEGLLEREDYREQGKRTRQSYRLTQKGAELFPVLAALMQWGDRWLTEDGAAVELRHQHCGERVEVQLRCEAGHRVEVDELELSTTERARTALALRKRADASLPTASSAPAALGSR